MIDFNKEIWEGWTVQDFINHLEVEISMIMSGISFRKPFKNRQELQEYLVSNQPYYKKPIFEVIDYFADKYCLS